MEEANVVLSSVTKVNLGFDMEPEVMVVPQPEVSPLAFRRISGSGVSMRKPSREHTISISEEKVSIEQRDIVNNPIAIRVRNAVKCFKSGVPVLDNINVTVPEGTIYTLLGSSGCGKTTLLSCIVGFQRIESGEILVFGNEPCSKDSGVPGMSVGYMPQEISLYESISTKELLAYFGMLYGMTNTEIQDRTEFLVNFLRLPDSSRWISTLSGGQRRRVSFAVSLLPDPPLLILDEPTVGVDPLLRESIWDHLVDLVSRKKTTVIITTHYIEESRRSDIIGFMRNGRLLIQKSPQALLDEYSSTLLTPIVLQLCKDDNSIDSEMLQDKNANSHGGIEPGFPIINTNQIKSLQNANEKLSCKPNVRKVSGPKQTVNHLWAMVKKNTLLMTRNYAFLIFLICVPAIQAYLFCLAVGNDPKPLPFGVVNNEVNFSTGCDKAFEEDGCATENLSCMYISKIPNDTVTLTFYETDENAKENLRNGKIWGYMTFPQEYSEHFYTRATAGGQFYDNETYAGSEIVFDMDATSKQITSALVKTFRDTFQEFARSLLRGCGFDERMANVPMKFNTPMYGNYSAGFREFLAPSLMLGILFFFPIISSSMQCIREKKQGTLNRTLITGVRTWEILCSYSMTESAIVLSQTALGFIIVSGVFQIDIKGSIGLVIGLCLLIGLSGVSMGYLIGNLCREETEAALLSMAVFFPNFILAGMFWPLEGLPVVLQYFSYTLPCTLASDAIRSIVNRGWGFLHPKVWPGFAITSGWIIFYWLLNIIIHRRASIHRKRKKIEK